MVSRREMLLSLTASVAATAIEPGRFTAVPPRPLTTVAGPDWGAVRDLFPLRRDWTHLASFLLVSHPKPVAESIDYYRRKLDTDNWWIEGAVLTDQEGRPWPKVKQALAEYIGGLPEEICLTSNTTTALAMAYHGLKIRADQEILTTDHDHYSHHGSQRFAAERSGASLRFVRMYDAPSTANADDMVSRIAREIRPNTRAVGITWVHSGTGVKTPVADFANTDVDVAKLGADFFCTGTHKWLFAPRGTGFLWGRKDVWQHMRPVVPHFDPDGLETWPAVMARQPLPPMKAAHASPGGFMAYEHILAIPSAVKLHRDIGRPAIAARIAELNQHFRDEASKIPNVTLHTPRNPAIAGGIAAYEVKGMTAAQVVEKLAARRIRTSDSPYQPSYPRVCAGVMNTPQDVDAVLREIRAIAG
jgi:isopenicillin-N epimerase